ncbi:DUF2938 domain-containing protein [Metapseudomonas otitidis]|uniref:DUF2938 domain-containing protein n=1 Tax=Metapseudomonas otitidis TaxID=319939 RepID=UPI0024489011|nr:DUF2938 domain-containing protein [Pseudomonas otitidis]MDH0338153.1 DUF2938 domain-containing protein [Pseudomonas otitidis]MDI6528300.1 DUF2938 domain-containing protein [Pseudomonas otitidis]
MNGETVVAVVGIGVGATLVMDLWGWLLRRLTGNAGLDYALVGRWVGHMPRGRFRHAGIGRAAPVRGERVLGWTCHYLIGIGFAALLVAVAGPAWLCRPSLWPALVFGLLSVAAPFLVMQPAFGLGIAAARTPEPLKARLRSLRTHLVFGLGLYLAALGMAWGWMSCAG